MLIYTNCFKRYTWKSKYVLDIIITNVYYITNRGIAGKQNKTQWFDDSLLPKKF